MPYLKFSRDKRGYEHFSIVEPGAPRRGKPSRSRTLFWFRTPPQIKVGRDPFTDEVRGAIEAQNPGLRFDWPRLLATPIPPPDAEHWRERRRAEKAARQAARDAAGVDQDAAGESSAAEPAEAAGPEQPATAGPDDDPGEPVDTVESVGAADAGEPEAAPEDEPNQAATTLHASESQEAAPAVPAAAGSDSSAGGRRRRRRGRRRHRPTAETAPGQGAAIVPVPPTEEV